MVLLFVFGLVFFFFFVHGHFSISHTALIMTATLQRGLPSHPKVLVTSFSLVCSLVARIKIFPPVPSRLSWLIPECTRCHLPFYSPCIFLSISYILFKSQKLLTQAIELGGKKKVINSNKIASCRYEIHNVFVI